MIRSIRVDMRNWLCFGKATINAVSLILLVAVCSTSVFAQKEVKINEVMIQPNAEESLVNCTSAAAGQEWVEIFNSDKCDTILLDCFILGANFGSGNNGAYTFPTGTKIAPLQFIVVGGPNAPNVDVVLNSLCGLNNLCGSSTWSLPNDNGWIALYGGDGTVQDAVFWTASAGQPGLLGSDPVFAGSPCVPSSPCTSPGTLKSASTMIPGSEILYAGQAPAQGLTIRRSVDGGGNWQRDQTPTPKSCNGVCVQASDLSLAIDSFANETCQLTNGYISVNTLGGVQPYEYDWSNLERDSFIANLDEGVYSITVTGADNCKFTLTQPVVNMGDTFSLSIIPSAITLFEGEEIQLQVDAGSTTVSTYAWSPTRGLNCVNCGSPLAKPRETTTYVVTVTDVNGCIDSAYTIISVLKDENSIFLPTAFTPEASTNNIFYVRSPRIASLEFRIYDRWGKEVFLSNSQSVGWNGTNKQGQKVNAGVYVYFVKAVFDNGKDRTEQGNVTLLR